jgi:subtilisin family serine protease
MKKRKKKERVIKVSVLVLSALLLNPLSNTSIPTVEAQTTISGEQILKDLTPTQLDALKKLELYGVNGLHLDPNVDTSSVEEISVIVQFKKQPESVARINAQLKGEELSEKEAKSNVETSHKAFKNDLSTLFKEDMKQRKSSFKINHEYKNALNGVSMTIPANKVEDLLKSEEVQAVWSNEEVTLDLPAVKEETTAIGSQSGTNDTLPFLGVDKLHAEGITGKDVKIGVLDTGVDYNHPDLKNAFKGGYDFIDNDSDPMETTYEDWKKSFWPETRSGSTYYTSHGTHVAGTIVGQQENQSDYASLGVAPDAELYAYRVLGPYGSGSTSEIIAGIDKAVADGMDVLNLSLGSSVNDPLNPASIAINNAVLSGVTAVVAAGNAGSRSYSLGSPGAAALALTVGASDSSITIATSKGTLHDGQETITADLRLLAKGFEGKIDDLLAKELPIVDVGFGDGAGFDGQDMEGKIALIKRGDIPLIDKIKNAKNRGAAAVIIWNDNPEEGFIPHYLGEGSAFISAFNTTNEHGLKLKEKVANGNATFSFDGIGQIKIEGDQLADFSSRGPAVGEYDIKPEVTAPGVSVMSTVPSYMRGEENIGNYEYAYDRYNGTSMATPHVAGIAALMLQSNPNLTPADIKTKLMNTADTLNGDYSVYEVGAGRVDPYEAIHSDTLFKIMDKTRHIVDGKSVEIDNPSGDLNFGLHVNNENLREHKTMTIENKSNSTKKFDVKVNFTTQSKDPSKNGVKLVTDDVVKVKAGKKINSTFFLVGHKKGELGSYEGYITYTNQTNPDDTYQIPFAFRYIEEKIEEIKIASPVMSSSIWQENWAPIAKKGNGLVFKMSAPTERVDVILVDGETGEELGYLGGSNTSNHFEGYNAQIVPIFGYGQYYPFTGDKDSPISDEEITAPPGHYKLKLVVKWKTGNVISKSVNTYVENNAPDMSLDIPSTTIEYEEGQETYPLTGSIHDPDLKKINELGVPLTEADNTITAYPFTGGYDLLPLANTNPQNPPSSYINLREDGKFNWDIPLDKPFKQVRILGQDDAGNGLYYEAPILTFVEKGTTYMQTSVDKKEINFNEMYTTTISANNAKDWVGGTFKVAYPVKNTSLVDIKVNPALEKLGQVNMTTSESGKDPNYAYVTVNLQLEGDDSIINGDVPLLDVKVKAEEETYLSENPVVTKLKSAIGLTRSGEKIDVYSDGGQQVKINPTFSTENFILDLEAIRSGSRNMNESGANITITDEHGNQYPGEFRSSSNEYQTTRIPLTSKTLTIKAEVPGHTTASKTVEIGREYHGKWIGTRRTENVRSSYAGDVNGDELIDINDVAKVADAFGKDHAESDINLDGIVDEKDIRFVEKNFLLIGPEAEKNAEPEEKLSGKGLEDYLRDLGLEPK